MVDQSAEEIYAWSLRHRMDLSHWQAVLVDQFACCRAFALLLYRADEGQRFHTDLLRMLDDLFVNLTLIYH